MKNMTILRRAAIGATAALAAALLVPAVTTSYAAATFAPVAPAEVTYRLVAVYNSMAQCTAAGDKGVQAGLWDSYKCTYKIQTGTLIRFWLWVTP